MNFCIVKGIRNSVVQKPGQTQTAPNYDQEGRIIVKIELTTADHEKLYGQYVEIKLDNGTQIKQKTDENGTITLDVDPDSNVKQIELIYQGDEKYSSARNVIRY